MNRHLAAKIGLWLTLVFIVVSLFGWDILKDMDRLQIEAKVIEKNNSRSHELHSIELAVNDCIGMVEEFLITGNYHLNERFLQRHQILITSIQSYEQKYEDDSLHDLAASINRIKSKAHQVFNLPFAVGNMEGPILSHEIKVEMQGAIYQLSSKHHELDNQVNGAMQMVDGLRLDMRSDAMALLLVLLLTLLLLTNFIYSQIVLPLVRMKKTAQQIGAGQLAVQCNVDSHDEIGELATAFNAMGEALQERELLLDRARALAAYQEKMNALGLISTGIAHEIGNPLAAISISLQLAQRKLNAEDKEAAEMQMQIAMDETDRIESIIQLMLNFARQDRDINMHLFDCEPMIDDAIRLAKISPDKKKIKITKNISNDAPKAYGSDSMVLQVMMNLIFNALHACEQGGEISISAYAEEGGLTIDVKDTGYGIPNARKEDVFKASFTTKAKGEGTGLGLAISRELMNSMGGSLQLIDDNKHGTLFRLCLLTTDRVIAC